MASSCGRKLTILEKKKKPPILKLVGSLVGYKISNIKSMTNMSWLVVGGFIFVDNYHSLWSFLDK